MWSSFFSMAFGIGSLIMGIVLSILPQKEKCNRTLRYSLLSLSIVLALFTLFYFLFTRNNIDINTLLIITVVIFFVVGIVIVLTNVPSSVAMMRIVDKDKFGKVSSVMNIGSQGLIPLAMFLGGLAITYLGSVGLLAVCSGGLIITALVLFFARPVRDL